MIYLSGKIFGFFKIESLSVSKQTHRQLLDLIGLTKTSKYMSWVDCRRKLIAKHKCPATYLLVIGQNQPRTNGSVAEKW